MTHEPRQLTKDTAAHRHRQFKRLFVDEFWRHTPVNKLRQCIVSLWVTRLPLSLFMQLDVGQKVGFTTYSSDTTVIKEGAGNGIHNGTVRPSHQFQTLGKDFVSNPQIRFVQIINQN